MDNRQWRYNPLGQQYEKVDGSSITLKAVRNAVIASGILTGIFNPHAISDECLDILLGQSNASS